MQYIEFEKMSGPQGMVVEFINNITAGLLQPDKGRIVSNIISRSIHYQEHGQLNGSLATK